MERFEFIARQLILFKRHLDMLERDLSFATWPNEVRSAIDDHLYVLEDVVAHHITPALFHLNPFTVDVNTPNERTLVRDVAAMAFLLCHCPARLRMHRFPDIWNDFERKRRDWFVRSIKTELDSLYPELKMLARV